MLSDAEREELLEMAASDALREDFRELRRGSEAAGAAMTPDALLAFLSYQARAFAAERFQRPPAEGRMLL